MCNRSLAITTPNFREEYRKETIAKCDNHLFPRSKKTQLMYMVLYKNFVRITGENEMGKECNAKTVNKPKDNEKIQKGIKQQLRLTTFLKLVWKMEKNSS